MKDNIEENKKKISFLEGIIKVALDHKEEVGVKNMIFTSTYDLGMQCYIILDTNGKPFFRLHERKTLGNKYDSYRDFYSAEDLFYGANGLFPENLKEFRSKFNLWANEEGN